MEILYQSSGISNFLNIKIDEADVVKVNRFRIRMLQENRISHLLSPVSTEVDGTLCLKYNLDSFYVFDRLLIKFKPDGNFFGLIIKQVFQCIGELERYLLNSDDLVLTPEYMFYNCDRRELYMIYIPGYGKNIRQQLRQFVEHIMKLFDHRDKAGVVYMYQIYDMVVSENFDYMALKQYVEEGRHNLEVDCTTAGQEEAYPHIYDTGGEAEWKEAEWKEPGSMKRYTGIFVFDIVAVLVLIVEFLVGENKIDAFIIIGLLTIFVVNVVFFVFILEHNNQENDMAKKIMPQNNIEENDMEKGDMVANAQWNICTYDRITKLVPLTNGGLLPINIQESREKIVVGRGKNDVDYRIPTTQISRIHALIHNTKEGIFIEDCNSTNGTFVNNIKLLSNHSERLKRGDLITFANEEFFVQ